LMSDLNTCLGVVQPWTPIHGATFLLVMIAFE
jgi:hypothetical protein